MTTKEVGEEGATKEPQINNGGWIHRHYCGVLLCPDTNLVQVVRASSQRCTAAAEVEVEAAPGCFARPCCSRVTCGETRGGGEEGVFVTLMDKHELRGCPDGRHQRTDTWSRLSPALGSGFYCPLNPGERTGYRGLLRPGGPGGCSLPLVKMCVFTHPGQSTELPTDALEN